MPKLGGVIYALGAVGTSLVKIGSTRTAVEKRRKQLQTGQPFALEVLATVAVETHLARIEKQVHAFLEAERLAGGVVCGGDGYADPRSPDCASGGVSCRP